MTIIALVFGLLCLPVYSARLFDRRNDLVKVSPASGLGFTVPLQAGQDCNVGINCKLRYYSSYSKPKRSRLMIGQVTIPCRLLLPTNHSLF